MHNRMHASDHEVDRELRWWTHLAGTRNVDRAKVRWDEHVHWSAGPRSLLSAPGLWNYLKFILVLEAF